MIGASSVPAEARPQILFLYPLVYRPEKDNFGKEFALISSWYRGHIYALSGAGRRDVSLSGFLFHAEPYRNGAISRLLSGLWIQTVVPIRTLAGKEPVEAVIAYDPYRSGIAALLLKYVLRCRMFVQINGDYHRTEPGGNPLGKLILRTVAHFVLARSDGIKVLNGDQEAYCRRTFPGTPVYRFPAFVATEYFQSLECHQGSYLLSIGHPFDLKGMDVLIAAFLRIAEKYPRIALRIMGYCSPEELARYAVLSEGHPRIEFIRPGWIEDVGEQVRNCYALVNAAKSEAMGRVHVEAMACGKPIVATRTNGAIECVEDGKTGLLCEIGNAEDLASKLDELLSDPERAEGMGRAGRIRAQSTFSEARYANEFHCMISEAIAGPMVRR